MKNNWPNKCVGVVVHRGGFNLLGQLFIAEDLVIVQIHRHEQLTQQLNLPRRTTDLNIQCKYAKICKAKTRPDGVNYVQYYNNS